MIAAPLARARLGVGYGPAVTARFGLVSRLEQLRIAIAARLDDAAALQASRAPAAAVDGKLETGLAATVRIDASARVAASRASGASLPAAVGDSLDEEVCRVMARALAASYEGLDSLGLNGG